MRRTVAVHLAAALVVGLVALTGCGSQTVATESGLRLTVPRGAHVEVLPPVPHNRGGVQVAPSNGDWGATFLSFGPQDMSPLDGQVVGSSEDSRVVVFGSPSQRSVVIETHLKGALPGRVVITTPGQGPVGISGLALARAVWKELQVQGATLP